MSREQRNARRDFLKNFGLCLGAGTAASFFPQLRVMEAALAQSTGDYKALVCVYLSGGNDAFNWLVPTDARLATYQASRGILAIRRDQDPQNPATPYLLDLASPQTPAGSYGVHSECGTWTDPQGASRPGVKQLFDSGRASFVVNVGPLVRPTTKAQLGNAAHPRPPQLYSHSDQTRQWQNGSTITNRKSGWGGLVADRLFGSAQGGQMPILISLGGNRFSVGEQTVPYLVSTSGATTINGFSRTAATTTVEGQRRLALDQLLNAGSYAHLFQAEHARIMRRSIDLAGVVTDALAATPNTTAPFNLFPVGTGNTFNTLADQLRMVARMIANRATFQHGRQIFYVSLGGFDIHSAQIASQPVLIRRISQALGAFQTALEQLGVDDRVLTFTMSEFGRTLNANGSSLTDAGSDHGWGSIQMVMGKSTVLNGGRIFGTFPDLTLNGPDCFSRGQFVPTTCSDQMSAALAQWMGVSGTVLPEIFPNLPNFSPTVLPLVA